MTGSRGGGGVNYYENGTNIGNVGDEHCRECESLDRSLGKAEETIADLERKLKEATSFDWQNAMIELTAERDRLSGKLKVAREALEKIADWRTSEERGELARDALKEIESK